jgi:hypothetical protein
MDFNKYIDELLGDIKLPSKAEIAAETKSEKIKLRLKGIKHSDETKRKLSESHIGKQVPKSTTIAATKGRKEQAWELLKARISKDDIINAINTFDNHQANVIHHLNTSYYPYKKLCEYYGIVSRKKSIKEKAEFAVRNQSDVVLVWHANNKVKGEFYKQFYSVSECCRFMNLHKGNMLRNMKNGTPYRNYFFEKKA